MNSQYISVLNIPDIIFMYSYGMYIMHMNLCVTIIIYNYLRILTITCFIFFSKFDGSVSISYCSCSTYQ